MMPRSWRDLKGNGRKGGPRTQRGKRIQMENLSKAGEANKTHGLYSWKATGLAPVCDSRCPVADCCDKRQGNGVLTSLPEDAAGKSACPTEVSKTCAVIAELRAEMIAACGEMTHLKPVHQPLVEEYATVRAMMFRADLWISMYDVATLEGGKTEVQPLVTARQRLSVQFVSLASELLVTPAAEARMKQASAETAREVLAGIVGAAMANGDVERAAKAMGIEEGNAER